MKDSKPRVLYDREDIEKMLGEMSARHGVTKKRLRGMAIEYAIDNSGDEGDFTEFVRMNKEEAKA